MNTRPRITRTYEERRRIIAVRAALVAAGVTRRELAAFMGTTYDALSQRFWPKGQVHMTEVVADQLIEALATMARARRPLSR
jgi:hypothetical protein